MPLLALAVLIALYFALAHPAVVAALRRAANASEPDGPASRAGGLMLALALLIPYLLATLPLIEDDPAAFAGGLARMAAYVAVPTLALLFRPRNAPPLGLLDLLAILALWLPIEFNWLPDVRVGLVRGVAVPLPLLTGVVLAFVLYLVVRPLAGVGYSYALDWHDWGMALLGLAGFALVALPLGIGTRFIVFGMGHVQPLAWLLKLLAIYFLIGVPEEMLFRGVIQNQFEQAYGQSLWTLIVPAIIFGAAHLDNATRGYPAPNFAYMLMATLAGLAYGWVWRRTGKITAAAVTHALVDWLWGVVFAG